MVDQPYFGFEINPRSYEKFPLDWSEVFSKEAPLAVEIGCGNGEFLTSWARIRPNWNLVGLELSLASCERSQLRLFRENLENVRIIRDDARFALREFFPDGSVRHIILNFPDPWPKDKHRDRRIYAREFNTIVAMVLELGGQFEIYTDQRWYAEEARQAFQKNNLFRVNPIERVGGRAVSTKYERKWREAKRSIFHLRSEKISHSQVKRILEGTEMPHFFVKKNIKKLKIDKLAGYEFKQDNKVFKIKEVFRKKDSQAYLLRTVTVDDDYMQNFFILAAVHDKGTIIKIDAGYQPYRTPAVKMAVDKIGQMLSE